MAAAQPPFALHPAWQWFVDMLGTVDTMDKVDTTRGDCSKALNLACRLVASVAPALGARAREGARRPVWIVHTCVGNRCGISMLS